MEQELRSMLNKIHQACLLEGLHSDGWQHKSTMSRIPVYKKSAKIQRLYVQLCGHTTFV